MKIYIISRRDLLISGKLSLLVARGIFRGFSK